MADSYNLYIVYSTQDTRTILDSLFSYSKTEDELGPIRKDYTRLGKNGKYIESNRKITLIKDSLYERLKEAGLAEDNEYDFKISPYEIRDDNYPPKDSVPHLFFPTSTGDEKEIILNKMNYFTKIGIIDEKCWKVNDNGTVKFEKKYPIKDRIKIKIILDDVEDKFRVSWCKRKYYFL